MEDTGSRMRKLFSASSFDANLSFRFEGEIHSVFSKAFNIRTRNDELISVVVAGRLNGPQRILLELSRDEDFLSLGIEKGMEAAGTAREISIEQGRFLISLGEARRWSSGVKIKERIPDHGIRDNLWFLRGRLSREKDRSRISQELRTRIQRLMESIEERDFSKISRDVESLIGFGEGLTPSGDDFLEGLIASLHFIGNSAFADSPSIVNRLRLRGSFRQSSIGVRNKTQPYYVRRNELRNPLTYTERQKKCKSPVGNLEAKHLLEEIKRVIHLEKEKTTFLSGKFLEYACQGRFLETIPDIIDAIFTKDREGVNKAARRCLDFGASSGRAILLGILEGLSLGVRLEALETQNPKLGTTD